MDVPGNAISLEEQDGTRSATASHGTLDQEDASHAVVVEEAQHPQGIRLLGITMGLVLSILLVALDSTIIATAIPSITDEFGSISNIAWYGSAYSITNTAFQSTWGKAYKYFKLKRTFLLAIAAFEIGNVICAAARNSNALILGRVVAGLGGGGVMTGSFIIIALTARPEYRAAYMGVLGVTFGCASVVGPLAGGALTDGPGWRWCFWISLPIGGVAAGMLGMFFSQHQTTTPMQASWKEKLVQMDLGGGILVTGSLTCFVLAMHWAGILPWNSAPVVGSLVGSALFALMFVLNERCMGSKAMIQGHLLKKRLIVLNLGFVFFLAGLYFPLLYSLPIQFQSINNTSASQSGIRLIPLVLGISLFTMVSNGLLTFWRHYNPFLVIGSLAGTAGVSLIYTLNAETSVATWIGSEVLTAIGIGLALQIPMIANQAAVSQEDIPSATALSLFLENIGTSLFVSAGEAAFTNGLIQSLQHHAPGLDPMSVVNVGATQIRHVFSAAELPGILMSYLEGCRISHTVSLACGAAATLISLVGAAPAGAREWNARMRKPHTP